MSSEKVWVRNSQMRRYAGKELDLGEIFSMRNQANDAKLLKLEYVIPVDKDVDPSQCLGCGREFVDVSYRNAHARRARHDAVVVDGPQLKQPPQSLSTPDPDSDRPWDLEPNGAPPPDKDVPLVASSQRGTRRTSSGETFRLGGR